MQPIRWFVRFALAGVTALFLFSGCGLLESFFYEDEEEEQGSGDIMSGAMEDLEKGRYEAATEAFQNIKDRYPYSKYAIMAELKMADTLYLRSEFNEAYEAYDEFEKLHPKHAEIPYVIYQKAMCHYRQITTIDRDQSYTLSAKQEFERLIRKFPRDDYANRARKNLRKCLIFLAEYELYVGHYYYRMGKYATAMTRYTRIIELYPDMGQYHEAMEYISRCREELAKAPPEASEEAEEEFMPEAEEEGMDDQATGEVTTRGEEDEAVTPEAPPGHPEETGEEVPAQGKTGEE
jgi:outer membrane protein assembly factor BamD